MDSKKRFLAKIYFIYLWEYTISYKISSQSDKNRKSSTWSTRSHSADNHDIWLSIGNPNIEGAMARGLLLSDTPVIGRRAQKFPQQNKRYYTVVWANVTCSMSLIIKKWMSRTRIMKRNTIIGKISIYISFGRVKKNVHMEESETKNKSYENI